MAVKKHYYKGVYVTARQIIEHEYQGLNEYQITRMTKRLAALESELGIISAVQSLKERGVTPPKPNNPSGGPLRVYYKGKKRTLKEIVALEFDDLTLYQAELMRHRLRRKIKRLSATEAIKEMKAQGVSITNAGAKKSAIKKKPKEVLLEPYDHDLHLKNVIAHWRKQGASDYEILQKYKRGSAA